MLFVFLSRPNCLTWRMLMFGTLKHGDRPSFQQPLYMPRHTQARSHTAHKLTHTLHRRHHHTRNPIITRPEDHPVWLDACYEEEPSPVSSPIPQSDTVTGKELCETRRSSYLEGPCCFFVFFTNDIREREDPMYWNTGTLLSLFPLPRPFIRSLSVFIITLFFFSPLCVCTS